MARVRSEPSDVEGRRVLEWCAAVQHVAVSYVHARLIASLGGARGSTSTPECTIEVWAEGPTTDNGVDVELAYCRGLLMYSGRVRAEVSWLGRSASRSVHERVRGWKCVHSRGQVAGQRDGAPAVPPLRTIAEAILGVTLTIMEMLGGSVVELQSFDNGSGKLNSLYLGLGFVKSENQRGSVLWMEAPVRVAEDLVPGRWIVDLVPSGFDGLAWMDTEAAKLWHERARFGKLPRWNWLVDWPRNARVDVRLASRMISDGEGFNLFLEASLLSPTAVQLTHCRGATRLGSGKLSVFWLGCGQAESAQASVRSRAAHKSDCKEQAGSCAWGLQHGAGTTSSIALLGLLAAIACWFGVVTVELQALDDGSGKLINYFLGLGFADTEGAPPGQYRDPLRPWLVACCGALARRCCPQEWRNMTLEAEDLQRFRSVEPTSAEQDMFRFSFVRPVAISVEGESESRARSVPRQRGAKALVVAKPSRPLQTEELFGDGGAIQRMVLHASTWDIVRFWWMKEAAMEAATAAGEHAVQLAVSLGTSASAPSLHMKEEPRRARPRPAERESRSRPRASDAPPQEEKTWADPASRRSHSASAQRRTEFQSCMGSCSGCAHDGKPRRSSCRCSVGRGCAGQPVLRILSVGFHAQRAGESHPRGSRKSTGRGRGSCRRNRRCRGRTRETATAPKYNADAAREPTLAGSTRGFVRSDRSGCRSRVLGGRFGR